jgi:acetolactate synthase small subunit
MRLINTVKPHSVSSALRRLTSSSASSSGSLSQSQSHSSHSHSHSHKKSTKPSNSNSNSTKASPNSGSSGSMSGPMASSSSFPPNTIGTRFLKIRRKVPLPLLPHLATPPSAEEAVNNILYNSPSTGPSPITRHILNCLVSNEPGVLSRISGILAARGFNIDSLVVAKTDVPDLSRMTVVLRGQDTIIEQARRQLEDLVPVWAVLDYTHARVIERELLLIKVSNIPHEELHHEVEGEDENVVEENHVMLIYISHIYKFEIKKWF